MADDRDDSDKTEDPTGKRLEDAIKRGDVVKSQEVNAWFVLAAAALVLLTFSGPMSAQLAAMFRGVIENSWRISADGGGLMRLFRELGLETLAAVAIPFLLLILAAIGGNAIQHRLVWSSEALTPRLSKISPLAGAKRLFSKQSLANFVKGLLKLAVVGTVLTLLLWPARKRLRPSTSSVAAGRTWIRGTTSRATASEARNPLRYRPDSGTKGRVVRTGIPAARMAMEQASDRTGAERRGSIGMVLLVAVLLIGAAAGLMLLGRERAEPYVFAMLAILGMIGIFSLFATAAGILHVGGRDRANPMLRALADGSTDGLLVTDPGGRVVYANAAYRALTDAVGTDDARPVERVFLGDPEVSETIYRLVKAAREGRRLQEEVRVVGPRGEPARWLRMRVRPLGDKGRDARTAVWTIADVTRDRHRHETAFLGLQHAIDYLDHAPAGFFSVDAAGHIGYLNATLADWLGHDLAQIGSGGLRLTDIVPGESASLLTQFNGDPGEVKTETLDLDLKTRAGKTLPVRLYHKVAFAADGAPGASRTLVLNRARDDGTDPQRAAEVRFIRFFHNTPLAIAAVDKTGRIVRANALAARLFHGNAEGRSIFNVVNAGDRGALEAAIAKAGRGQADIAPIDAALAGAPDAAEPAAKATSSRNPAHADNERWARFYVTPVGDAQGDDHEAAIAYALDTTEQRNLQHQFNQTQKMELIGELAGGTAHEINNLLNIILLATDFLLTTHRPTDPSFQDIMQIKHTATSAGAVVQQLLAFARKQTMRTRVIDLDDALSEFAYMLRRTLGERVTLDFQRARDLWPVKADINQFQQVILNLAVNAGHAMPDGGKLTIKTTNVSEEESRAYAYQGMPPGDYVMVEVTDTGTGIAPEIMDKIFLPFFSTKETGKGTGLGLATVYGIVKQSGGFVYPELQVGKGTTFRIFLPRHLPSAEPQGAAPAIDGALAAAEQLAKVVSAPAADDTGQGTILLVEDEKDLRNLNARGLSSRGYTVLQAGNGVEAIDILEHHSGEIDLVVSDVVMPEMDGPALLKELRQRKPDLKIIFVSGYAEEAFANNEPQGQHAFLAKPFELKTLVAKVKETMAS